MKRPIGVMLSAALALSAFPVGAAADEPAAAEQESSKDIVVLYTNDVHCGIDDYIGYDGLALYKREMQTEYDSVLLVDAGDAIQGSPVGTLSNGGDIIPLMNKLGYDVCVPGNHEFDYTVERLIELGGMNNAGYTCCNFFSKLENKRIFEPYKMIEAEGRQIAFIGVTTPDTFISSTPTNFQDSDGNFIYSFAEGEGELYEVVQNTVDAAVAEGADSVILVGHLGETGETAGWTAFDVAANTTGIDCIIDGHSHETTPTLTVTNKNGEDVLISQTGTKLVNIGKLTIHSDGSMTTELISEVPEPTEAMGLAADSYTRDETRGVYVDTEVSAMIAETQKKVDEVLSGKIGESPFKLYDCDPETGERRVRNGETNLGDLIADASKYILGTDIGYINGGGVRASIEAGDITYNDAITVLPYGNMMCSARITGQQLLDLLESGCVSYPVENSSFPHVSGVTFSIDPTVKSSVVYDEFGSFKGVEGEYRVYDVYVNGEPLDTEKTYTIATHNYYLKQGGDGYIMSGKCELIRDEVISDSEMLAIYIRDYLGGVVSDKYKDPAGLGRITVKERPDDDSSEPEDDSSVPDDSSTPDDISQPDDSSVPAYDGIVPGYTRHPRSRGAYTYRAVTADSGSSAASSAAASSAAASASTTPAAGSSATPADNTPSPDTGSAAVPLIVITGLLAAGAAIAKRRR